MITLPPLKGFEDLKPIEPEFVSRPPAHDGNPNSRAFEDMDTLHEYLFGGYGTITVQSRATGKRFTYELRKPKEHRKDSMFYRKQYEGKPKPIFVSVLTGPFNTASYEFMGSIFPVQDEDAQEHVGTHRFQHSRRSRIKESAPSAIAFKWFLRGVMGKCAQVLTKADVWHEGTCCRCGRKLTVPTSIEAGIGPECARKLEGE